MLLIFHQMNYGPIRLVMKARDVVSGYTWTVNPGNNYGFNFRQKDLSGLEIAIGTDGIWLMTNDGQPRNILTTSRRDRFNIYAILEFAPVINDLPDGTIFQQAPTNDGSLDA